jgi:hypothetical protein
VTSAEVHALRRLLEIGSDPKFVVAKEFLRVPGDKREPGAPDVDHYPMPLILGHVIAGVTGKVWFLRAGRWA